MDEASWWGCGKAGEGKAISEVVVDAKQFRRRGGVGAKCEEGAT